MAQITISSDHKLDTIVQLSGAESGTGSYDGIDALYVEGVTQEALDTALARAFYCSSRRSEKLWINKQGCIHWSNVNMG